MPGQSIAKLSERITEAERLAREEQDEAALLALEVPGKRPTLAAREANIEVLVDKATRAIAQDRLTAPANENAVKHVRDLVGLDPENSEAQRLSAGVRDRYIALADKAVADAGFAKARDFERQAREIASEFRLSGDPIRDLTARIAAAEHGNATAVIEAREKAERDRTAEDRLAQQKAEEAQAERDRLEREKPARQKAAEAQAERDRLEREHLARQKVEALRLQQQLSERMPKFPWPPPQASATEVIPCELFQSKTGVTRFGDVDTRLRKALEGNGYFERSYYAVPDGFALVTRIEHTNSDGTPRKGLQRWRLDVPRLDEFSLSGYLSAVFLAPPGFYRVIVFFVTPHPVVPSQSPVMTEEIKALIGSGASRLPRATATQDASPKGYPCAITVFVYEFNLRTESDQPAIVNPGQISGRTHLVGAGLWTALTR